jgi:protein-S-isoprenylcysteine O-methyltransferase Ste14
VPFRATDVEFARRFWIITLVYCIGFGLTVVDPANAGVWLIGQLVPSVDLAGAAGRAWLRGVFAGGAALVFLAALLRTWATAYLLADVVHDSRRHSDELVADGPFRYVRNPLYLATLLVSAGVGLLASPLGWLFIVVLNGLFLHRLILAEEETLRRELGDAYRDYCTAVPRFWPALRPRVPARGRPPRWGQAFGGEAFPWLLGLSLLAFAATLEPAVALVGIAASFVVRLVVVRRLSGRPAPRARQTGEP